MPKIKKPLSRIPVNTSFRNWIGNPCVVLESTSDYVLYYDSALNKRERVILKNADPRVLVLSCATLAGHLNKGDIFRLFDTDIHLIVIEKCTTHINAQAYPYKTSQVFPVEYHRPITKLLFTQQTLFL